MTELVLHRIDEVSRQVQLLRETLDRRVYIDDVIDAALVGVESEIGLLRSTVKQTIKEK